LYVRGPGCHPPGMLSSVREPAVLKCPPVSAPRPPRAWLSHGATRRGGAGLHSLVGGSPRRKGGDRFGRNRDGLPGTGIPARPRRAVAELKASKASQFHGLPRLQGV